MVYLRFIGLVCLTIAPLVWAKPCAPLSVASELETHALKLCEVTHELNCREVKQVAPQSLVESGEAVCRAQNEESATGAVVSCGSVAAYAGLQTLIKLRPTIGAQLIKATPHIIKSALTKLVPQRLSLGVALAAASTAAIGITAYQVTSMMITSIEADKKCYNDIEHKRLVMAALRARSLALAKRVKEKVPQFKDEERLLVLPESYLKENFLRELSCQRMRELEIQLDRKQKQALGPLVAQGIFAQDPRRDLSLSSEEMASLELILKNEECFSPLKLAELTCAIGNAAIGGRELTHLYLQAKRRVPIPRSYSPRAEIKEYRKQAPADMKAQALGLSIQEPPTPLSSFVYKSAGEQQTFEFITDSNGRRFQLSRSQEMQNTFGSKLGRDLSHRWQIAPEFEKKLGITRLPDGRLSRPADAKTQNELIEQYNSSRPTEEQIPLRIKDDFSKTGWKDEEMVRNWIDGYVPLNQRDPYYHSHDSLFHIPHYLHVPQEVWKRSRANMQELVKLLDGPEFKDLVSLKTWIYSDLGRTLDRDTLVVVVGSAPEGLISTWNNLIISPENIRKKIEQMSSLSHKQRKALEETLARFKSGLNESEGQHQLRLARRRALAEKMD